MHRSTIVAYHAPIVDKPVAQHPVLCIMFLDIFCILLTSPTAKIFFLLGMSKLYLVLLIVNCQGTYRHFRSGKSLLNHEHY